VTAPVVVSSQAASTASATSITLTIPFGTSTGHLLVAAVTYRGTQGAGANVGRSYGSYRTGYYTGGGSSTSTTPPQNVTVVTRPVGYRGGYRGGYGSTSGISSSSWVVGPTIRSATNTTLIYYRFATSTDTAGSTATFVGPVTPGPIAGAILAISGVTKPNPFDGPAVVALAAGGVATLPSMTVDPDVTLLSVFGANTQDALITASPPSGQTVSTATSGGGGLISVALETGVVGVTGVRAWSLNRGGSAVAVDAGAIQVALQPSQFAATRRASWNVAGRGLVATRRAIWRVVGPLGAQRSTTWAVAQPVDVAEDTTWQQLQPVSSIRRAAWQTLSSVTNVSVLTPTVQLRIYDPIGDDRGVIPTPANVNVAYPLNDLGSLTFEYSPLAPRSELLGRPCEIAVEYSADGGFNWTEPYDSRFLYNSDERDPLQSSSSYSVQTKPYIWRLTKTVVWDSKLNAEGKRAFLNTTIGQILKTLLGEAQARGALAGFDHSSFSPSTDSAGLPWARGSLDFYYDPGVNYLSVLQNMADRGFIDYRMKGRSLYVYSAETTFSNGLATLATVPVLYGNMLGGYDLHDPTRVFNGKDWAARIPAQIALIRSSGAELCFMVELHEEVGTGLPNGGTLYFLAQLRAVDPDWAIAEGKGGNHLLYRPSKYTVPAVKNTLFEQGNRWFSDFTIKHSTSGLQKRACLAHFIANGTDAAGKTVDNTPFRKAQAAELAAYANANGIDFFTGDFNSATETAGYPRAIFKSYGWTGLREHGTVTNGAQATAPSAAQGWIEDIWSRADAPNTNSRVIPTNGVSDHLGWLATTFSWTVNVTGGPMSVDRSTGPAPVVLRAGRDLTEAPFRRTWEGLADSGLFVGDLGRHVTYTNPRAITPWGRQEVFFSNGDVRDIGTMLFLIQSELRITGDQRTELTHGLDFTRATSLPFRDYFVGDNVLTSVDGSSEPVSLRLRQITLSVKPSGQLSANAVLNDRFLEADIRSRRRIEGITNGASGAASPLPGGTPKDNSDKTVPAKVLGLVGSSYAYTGQAGTTQAGVALSWAPVETNTDGTDADDIDHYEVWTHGESAPANQYRLASLSDDTELTLSPYRPGTTWRFKVRAFDRANNRSAFSDVITVVMAVDTTPPQAPSMPTITSRLGVLTVTWDGKPATAAWPPDFDHVDVHISTVNDFTPTINTLVDRFYASSSTVVTSAEFGVPIFAKLVAVDDSSLQGPPSAQATGTASRLVGTDLDPDAITFEQIGYKDQGNAVDDGSFETAAYREEVANRSDPAWTFSTAGAFHGGYCATLDSVAGSGTLRSLELMPSDAAQSPTIKAGEKLFCRYAYKGATGSNGTLRLGVQWYFSDRGPSTVSTATPTTTTFSAPILYGNMYGGYQLTEKAWNTRVPAQVQLIKNAGVDLAFMVELHEEVDPSLPQGGDQYFLSQLKLADPDWALARGAGGNQLLYRPSKYTVPGVKNMLFAQGNRYYSDFTIRHTATGLQKRGVLNHFIANGTDAAGATVDNGPLRAAQATELLNYVNANPIDFFLGDFNSATETTGFPRAIFKAGGWTGLRERGPVVNGTLSSFDTNPAVSTWIEDIWTRPTQPISNSRLIVTNGASDHNGWLATTFAYSVTVPAVDPPGSTAVLEGTVKNGVWQQSARQVTAPAGVTSFRLYAYVDAATIGSYAIDAVEVRRTVGTAIIEDAAISNAQIANLAVNNAKIASVDVGKLTAGQLNADMLIASRLMTATAGQRLEMSASGLRMFDETGFQRGWWNPQNGQLRIYNQVDASHTSTGHSIQFGDDNKPNIIIDDNEIMARINGGFGQLYLNREGGEVLIGGKVGGFALDGSDTGVFPATQNYKVTVRAALGIHNVSDGNYADEFPPLLVGRPGGAHTWMDGNEIGATAATGDAVGTLFLQGPASSTDHHVESVVMASGSFAVRRWGVYASGTRSTLLYGRDSGNNVGIRFATDQFYFTDSDGGALKPIEASNLSFTSSRRAKHSFQSLDDALGIVKRAPASRWKYVDDVETDDTWHVGPMFEDLPAEVRMRDGDPDGASPVERLGSTSLPSLVGVLWEAVRVLSDQVEELTRHSKPEPPVPNPKAPEPDDPKKPKEARGDQLRPDRSV
jgi:hypothetical protein